MKKNIFIFVIFFVFLLSPIIIFGQTEVNYPSLPGVITPQEIVQEIQSGKEAFPLFMNYIFQLLLVVSLLVTIGVVSCGGIIYFFSNNNVLKKKSARNWIISAIQGLLIILVSYTFLFALDSNLVLFHLRGLTGSEKLEKFDLEWKIENTYFQIPFGLLIEDAILNENAKSKLFDVLDATNAAEANADAIYSGSKQLLSLVEMCPQGNPCCAVTGVSSSSISYSEPIPSNIMSGLSGATQGLSFLQNLSPAIQQAIMSAAPSLINSIDPNLLGNILNNATETVASDFLKQAVTGFVTQQISQETGIDLSGISSLLSGGGSLDKAALQDAVIGSIVGKISQEAGINLGFIVPLANGSMSEDEAMQQIMTGIVLNKISQENPGLSTLATLAINDNLDSETVKQIAIGTISQEISQEIGGPAAAFLPAIVNEILKTGNTPTTIDPTSPAWQRVAQETSQGFNVDGYSEPAWNSESSWNSTNISTNNSAIQSAYTSTLMSTDKTVDPETLTPGTQQYKDYYEAKARIEKAYQERFGNSSSVNVDNTPSSIPNSSPSVGTPSTTPTTPSTTTVNAPNPAYKTATQNVSTAQTNVNTAQANLDKANADVATAQVNLDKADAGYWTGGGTSKVEAQQELNIAKAKQASAVSALNTANTQLNTAQTALSNTPSSIPSQVPSTGVSDSYWDQWGGKDAYATSQQARYDEAFKTGDTDLQARLEADAERVGYDLEKPDQYSSGHEYYQENPMEEKTAEEKAAEQQQIEKEKMQEDRAKTEEEKAAEQQGGEGEEGGEGGEGEEGGEGGEEGGETIGGGCGACPLINPPIAAKIAEIQSYIARLGQTISTLLSTKDPLKEDLYQLYKAVMLQSLGYRDILNYNSLLLERRYLKRDEILIVTDTEKSSVNGYTWNWGQWIDNILYQVNTGGKLIKENDPATYYLKKPEADKIIADALILAKEAKGISVTGTSASAFGIGARINSAGEYTYGANYPVGSYYENGQLKSEITNNIDGYDVTKNDIQEAGRNIGISRKFPSSVEIGTTLFPPVVIQGSLKVTSPFGLRTHPITQEKNSFHKGVDLSTYYMPPSGSPIYAAEDGEVIFAGNATGYGKIIVIYHKEYNSDQNTQNMATYYAHLKEGSFLVKKGDFVKRGQHIAGMGSTGNSTGTHLHFELRTGSTKTPFSSGTPIDPLPYINNTPSSAFSSPQDLLSYRKEFFTNIAKKIVKNTFTKTVSAETELERLNNYFEDNNIDFGSVSEKEMKEILEKLGIDANSSTGITLGELDLLYPGDYLTCGLEIPIGEAFELTWLHLVEILDTVDSYISEAENLIMLQSTMNALAAPCSCPCIGCCSDHCGACQLTCSKGAVQAAHALVGKSREELKKIAAHITLLTSGHFNTPTENICDSLNQDIRDEQERLLCQGSGNKLVSNFELITRKLNYSRFEFDECITRPEQLEDVLEGKRAGQLPFFAPIVEEDGLSRYTKTKQEGTFINTSNFNWFCCSDSRFED